MLSVGDDSPLSSDDSPPHNGFEHDDITLSSESAHDDSGADRAASIDDEGADSTDDIKISTDDSTHQNQETMPADSAVITDQRANQHQNDKPIDGGHSAQNQQISTAGGCLSLSHRQSHQAGKGLPRHEPEPTLLKPTSVWGGDTLIIVIYFVPCFSI